MSENIALIGAPGSGKSSIAKEYALLVGGAKMSFADGLREEVAYALAAADALQNISRDAFAARQLVRHYMALMTNVDTKDTYRSLLQFWGTEFRRGVDDDYWVKRFTRRAERRGTAIAVDDCRFPNEYAALKKLGFKFVLLEPGDTTRELTAVQAKHESEKYWPKFKVDMKLPYKKGPRAQAMAIVKEFRDEAAPADDTAITDSPVAVV